MTLVNKDRLNQLKGSVERGTATAEAVTFYNEQLHLYDVDVTEVAKACKEALSIAKDFFYPQSVKDAIAEAKSCSAINRIMKDAKKYI